MPDLATLPLSITRERFVPDLLMELRDLVVANHAATESDAPLSPQWVALHDLDLGDALCLIVARVDGRPVGYCAHVMQNHQLYAERWAVCVAIYLLPEHRGLARGLVREAERLAGLAGAARVVFNVPHLSTAGAFFERIGYGCMELVMGKRLG